MSNVPLIAEHGIRHPEPACRVAPPAIASKAPTRFTGDDDRDPFGGFLDRVTREECIASDRVDSKTAEVSDDVR